MKRRAFLNALLAAGGTATLWPARGLPAVDDYAGRFLVVMHAGGGWDVTSLCDPKMNVPGELEINRWSRLGETQSAGNIQFAPFADNATLFQKYYRHMLIINGIDTQTNAHEAGVLHTWSGRLSSGFPSLTALFSSAYAPDLPMSYINYGGYGETANLIRYTRLGDVNNLRSLLAPNRPYPGETAQYLEDAEMAAVFAAHEARAVADLSRTDHLPRYRRLLSGHRQAFSQTGELERFLDVVPDDGSLAPIITDPDPAGPVTQDILRQAQLSVLAFKAGVACAADLIVHSFDTHAANDEAQEPKLATFARGVDYLWEYAEEQGIADRMTVVLSSDFGRTPHYNSVEGKDHWPIGSVIIMEKNAPWGNRVVGLTDEGHNAFPINPSTLQRDDRWGTLIYPKHVHKALRSYLGLDGFDNVGRFPFPNTQRFDFFNPAKSTL